MKTKLSEIITVLESGSRPKGGVKEGREGVPSLGGEHLSKEGGFNFSKLKMIPNEFYSKMKRGKIEIGDILIVKDGATTGKTAIVREDFPFKEAAINEHLFRIRVDSDKAVQDYIFRYLQSPLGQLQILSSFRGAAIGGINTSFVDRVSLDLPSVSEQKRVAAILDMADEIKECNEHFIDEKYDLFRSLFIDMFGDPNLNPMNWETNPVIDYCTCIVPGRDKPKSFTGNTPWVTTADLNHLGTTYSSRDGTGLTDIEIKQVRARVIPKSSVILTCVGDLGVVSIAGRDMVVNQQLHSFQCSDKINNIFLMHSIAFQTPYMGKMASSTTVPYMNKTIANNIPTIFPPLELQEKFADIVLHVTKLFDAFSEKKAPLEDLSNSIAQEVLA